MFFQNYGNILPILLCKQLWKSFIFCLLIVLSTNVCFFQVLKQLPPKQDHIKFCPLSQKQQQLYNDLMNKLKRSVEGTGNLYQIKLAIDGSKFGWFSSDGPSFNPLWGVRPARQKLILDNVCQMGLLKVFFFFLDQSAAFTN